MQNWRSDVYDRRNLLVSHLCSTPGYQQNKFGDEYKLFLLINPEDEKPVAVVIPKQTLQPETTGDKILGTFSGIASAQNGPIFCLIVRHI